jgi:hypothetical protein
LLKIMLSRKLRSGLLGWFIAAFFGTVFSLSPSPTYAVSSEVAPINWAGFTAGRPTDTNATRLQTILRNTNEYALTTWWNTAKNFDAQSGSTYLSFGGTAESNIRPSASEALALAIAIKTGAYDASVTGVSLSDATARTAKLVRSLAYHHKAREGSSGWGNVWQSALWATLTGTAGWLLWEEFSTTDRGYIRDMVEYESNRFNSYTVPYYRNKAGTIVSAGDSKGEENSWNAMLLQLATNMMPNHPNWHTWMNKNLELMISAYARPLDTTSATVLNGKALSTWLNGSNINNDGMMVNHNIIHPDYAASVTSNLYAGLIYSLGGRATPVAALHNANVIYDAMVDLSFTTGASYPGTSSTVLAPGGTIYRDGASDIYYPQGNDWGTRRRMNFAGLDAHATAFGLDGLASQSAGYWEGYHAQEVLHMQNRHADGHTYADNTEDNYSGKEEWVALLAGRAYLAKWLVYQGTGAFRTSNQNYQTEVGIDNLSGGWVTLSGAWVTANSNSQRIGTDYLHDNQTNKGSCSARFTPNLPSNGTYKVYVYYSAAANRSNNVPVDITHAGGTTTVYVNQQVSGGQWVQIGASGGYSFNAGTDGYVTIRNGGTTGYVMADAVRFVKV